MSTISNSPGFEVDHPDTLSEVNHPETSNLGNLPVELVIEIFEYLSIQEVLQMTSVSKSFNILGNDGVLWNKLVSKLSVGGYPSVTSLIKDGETGKECCKRVMMERARIEQKIPDSIINGLFGGIENFRQNTAPLLYEEFRNYEYIDFLGEESFPEGKSILFGVDPFDRPFVSFKVQVIAQVPDEERKLSEHYDRKTDSVFTIFQRYTTGGTWCMGTNEMRNSVFCGLPGSFNCERIGQGENADQHEYLISLINGETLMNEGYWLDTENGHYSLSLYPSEVKSPDVAEDSSPELDGSESDSSTEMGTE